MYNLSNLHQDTFFGTNSDSKIFNLRLHPFSTIEKMIHLHEVSVIMGTTFDTTERYSICSAPTPRIRPDFQPGTLNWKGLALESQGLSGIKLTCPHIWIEADMLSSHKSSATDKIMHQTVSLKKLAQPFRCSDIAQQVFREVKILKYPRHENVRRLGVIANSETNQ